MTDRPLVLITGGTRGIGAATAIMAARRGYDVAFTYRTEKENADRIAGLCRAEGVRARALYCDVSIADDVIRTFAELDASAV